MLQLTAAGDAGPVRDPSCSGSHVLVIPQGAARCAAGGQGSAGRQRSAHDPSLQGFPARDFQYGADVWRP